MAGAEVNAIQRICKDLGLPLGDSFTQDWSYELPETFRDEASFYRYLSAYRNEEYGAPEKRVLMQLMLDIANDLLQEDREAGRRAWNALVGLIRTNYELHRNQIEYWAVPAEPLEDAFALTPLARTLWEELFA